MSSATTSIQQTAINTIRTLSMDAVQTANSGHPGTPMALAPVTYQLWNETMRYDPQHPQWPNRDRFVLSCGHASMLLYSILHLTGVQEVDSAGEPIGQEAITLDNIKNFRQLESPCAGHPEYGEASGIETTTGPLGQGCATSVGMATASRWLAARYNTSDHTLFDNDVYVLCSDGDLMEGVACEAASLAGHLKLSNLCWIYDDNKITIEGNTDLAFSENQVFRFKGYGWNVIEVDDANDLESLSGAIAEFKSTTDAPTLIVMRSIIGYGSPNKANTHGAHGSPLGWDEVDLTKKAYGWPETEKFAIPAGVKEHFQAGVGARGADAYSEWQELWKSYQKANADKAAELETLFAGDLPDGWDSEVPTFDADAKGMASRVSGGQVLNAVAAKIPWMVGGSADLAPSTNTLLKFDGAGHNSAETPCGRNMHFGIREHAMSAVCNGMSLTGLRSYGATFFVFTDYMRGGMRLSSIMHQPVLYVLTHDSIGLGEDGPTHQPVEHLAACRAMPGLYVFRPGDANEVAAAYKASIAISDHPSAMVLSRQNLPTLCRDKYASADGVARGGYVIAESDGEPQVILMATGSELTIAIDAYEQLKEAGVKARVVSMPCFELFEDQDAAYRESVLPAACPARVAVEAGVRQCWDRYLGTEGEFVGMDHFGASAPAAKLYERFGITTDNVVAEAKALLP